MHARLETAYSFIFRTHFLLLLIVCLSPQCARVDHGTFVEEAISKEVDSIHLSAYLFNITNAERFISGEDDKIKMEEVGPFTYQ